MQSAQAAAALGIVVEYETIEMVLQRLPEHSGLEAWWLTAEVAAVTNPDRFWTLAETYAERMAAHSGDYADTFRRYAGAQLERIRSVGVSG